MSEACSFSSKYLVHTVRGPTSQIPQTQISDPRVNVLFQLWALVLQILIWLRELSPTLNFQKWQDEKTDLELHFHSGPHHTSPHVTATHLGRLYKETKSSPRERAKGKGDRWFRAEKQTHGPRMFPPAPQTSFPKCLLGSRLN